MSFEVLCDEKTGLVRSCKLYGAELLDPTEPCRAELYVNDRPLRTRLHPEFNRPGGQSIHQQAVLKGEEFLNFWTGYSLVIARTMGPGVNIPYHGFGIEHWVRREPGDVTQLPIHGPGGPLCEAPLWVDTLSVLNWNWRFWGDDTRMLYVSAHSNGPTEEWGHCGYEEDVPEKVKPFLQSPWRRLYPGTMAVHGGVYYNARTQHWLAVTCRRAGLSYLLNLDKAGRGLGYDFKLHAQFPLNELIRLPEIIIYHGETREEMMRFLAEYITYYVTPPPEWLFRTHFADGLCWNNLSSWAEQGRYWEKLVADGLCSGFSYSLVTDRPLFSGTSPISYRPDPRYGTRDDFRRMCRRLSDRGVPLLIWMSHSGLLPGDPEVDDDWFVRGIDGQLIASWGDRNGGMCYCNPGHPGYQDYTCEWIRFYLRECGCKGIFFDCYGFGIPADFRPRSFMRYPADSARLAIQFMDRVHACVKECDPEAIVCGEGASLDGAIDHWSINANPRRPGNPWGPRDFFLALNRWSHKRIIIDQGPMFNLGAGLSKCNAHRPELHPYCRYATRLLRERGCRDAVALPGDLSILDDLLVVAFPGEGKAEPATFALPAPWTGVTELVEEINGAQLVRGPKGCFTGVAPGFYRMRG